jgi:hypothetical protein
VFAASAAVLALALIGTDSQLAGASSLRVCGVERWAVKTLTDRDARFVDFRARRTTVEALRGLRPPTPHGRRLRSVETTVYRVRVRLLAVKLEDDQDIHLVIADPATGGTMIAESPAPACTRGAAPAVRRMMARARASIIRACGIPPSRFFAILGGAATISGVGFFDFKHGQRGVAPILSLGEAEIRAGRAEITLGYIRQPGSSPSTRVEIEVLVPGGHLVPYFSARRLVRLVMRYWCAYVLARIRVYEALPPTSPPGT